MAPSKHIAAVVIQALVKIVAASLNPTDWKTAQRDTSLGNVSGCDFAGVVEELGPGADAFLKVGQRVTTFVPGARSNNSNGAYAQYVVTKADVCVTIPDSWSFETAAQLPIAVFTACQCLYQSLPFSIPPASSAPIEDSILIYGASSSVGTYVVQLAKITGLKVYATCSPKNFDLVRGFGADEVYDYRDPDAPKKIRDATGGKLRYAVDTISEHGSSEFISGVLAEDLDGMKIACILPFEGKPRENVELVLSVAYDLITPRPDSVLRLEDGPKYAKLVTTLLAEGKLKPAPILVMPNGLGSVNDGFKYMMDGKVSAQKVIFRIADTDGLL